MANIPKIVTNYFAISNFTTNNHKSVFKSTVCKRNLNETPLENKGKTPCSLD